MATDPQPLHQPIDPPTPEAKRTWVSKLLSLCFVIFCFEIGVFLVVFPWLDYWNTNSLSAYSPWLEDLWDSPYFRGALSGIGLANIYISFLEIIRLIRGQVESATADQLK